jgi:prepilin-type processing-associated H-X9-DG protein
VHLYHEALGSFPSGSALPPADKAWGCGWEWSATILPYVEATNLGQRINYNLAPNDYNAANAKLQKTFLPFYQCPSAEPLTLTACWGGFVPSSDGKHVAETSYAATATHTALLITDPTSNNAGRTGSGCLYDQSGVGLAQIVDGSSQTLLITERIPYPDKDPVKTAIGGTCPNANCDWAPHWDGGARVTTHFGINNPSAPFWSHTAIQSSHPGGANFALADGHVTFLSESIRLPVLWALTTRGPGVTPATEDPASTPYGGEVINDTEY